MRSATAKGRAGPDPPPPARAQGSTVECPFGPNYGSDAFKYVCSLEGAPDWYHQAPAGHPRRLEEGAPCTPSASNPCEGPWGDLPQRAFFVPNEHIGPTWAWAQTNRGDLDLIKHPSKRSTSLCVFLRPSQRLRRHGLHA